MIIYYTQSCNAFGQIFNFDSKTKITYLKSFNVKKKKSDVISRKGVEKQRSFYKNVIAAMKRNLDGTIGQIYQSVYQISLEYLDIFKSFFLFGISPRCYEHVVLMIHAD